MPKVFLIERPKNRFDVSSAEKFGEIVYVFDHEDRRCSAWEHDKFGRTVLRRLKTLDFNSARDHVCIVGSILMIVIVTIAISQCYDKFNILLFHSADDRYVSKRLNKKDWME